MATNTPAWKDQITHLLATKGRVTSNRKTVKPVSNLTIQKREEILFLCFRQLEEMRMCPANIKNIAPKHITALGHRWEQEGLSAATISSRLSILRILCEWLDKKGMVTDSTDYVINPDAATRSATAKRDHSWSAHGINVDEVLTRVAEHDKYVGTQLLMMAAFGLRREEAIMLKPHRAHVRDTLIVREGTKGGRERTIQVETERQKAALEQAKALAGTVNQHLGRPGLSLKQSIIRFQTVMDRFGITRQQHGITAHGLRHEFLNDLFEKIAGEPSPVRGGNIANIPPERLTLARARVSEAAGHARLSISGAYIGGMLGQKWKSDLTPEEQKMLQEYTRLKYMEPERRTPEEKDRYIELMEWHMAQKARNRL